MKTLRTVLLVIVCLSAFASRTHARDTGVNTAINTVTKQYLALKNALAAGDAPTAASAAKTLMTTLQAVPEKAMTAAQLQTWKKYKEKLVFDSDHISEQNELAHKRDHFATLSDNVFLLLKGLKINNTVLYRQYCTMTKHYFVSESAGGKDPYMGMLNCSKVTDTLKPSK